MARLGLQVSIENVLDTKPNAVELSCLASSSPACVLVVEDFLPFRQYIISKLLTYDSLLVICELSDGLEAVQKAEELQPALILLDMGLPTLGGIEAARRILKLSPDSKIIFLTQESSVEVVREALDLGARGYVSKTKAATDLRPAVEAVLEGGQFISDGLDGLGRPTN